ncbi:MAG: thiamine pyrophosphate-binding protein [Alphaproteobacteria bacterium]|nr:thiamine pyrophosphate-binding protein [Alphaproteobacteria bacterium]
MNGGEALVETLVAWGIEAAFAVPGESYLPVLAALQRRANAIRLVTPRHESGVTFACAAYGRIAGKPSVGLVSRGPGSTNASIGLHVARQDSVPMLLVIGDVPTASKGREAFQEIDYHNMFSGITKAVLEPASAAEVPAKAARALELAMAGRPGPVVLVMRRIFRTARQARAPFHRRRPVSRCSRTRRSSPRLPGVSMRQKDPSS